MGSVLLLIDYPSFPVLHGKTGDGFDHSVRALKPRNHYNEEKERGRITRSAVIKTDETQRMRQR
jgi:hypothetical protein